MRFLNQYRSHTRSHVSIHSSDALKNGLAALDPENFETLESKMAGLAERVRFQGLEVHMYHLVCAWLAINGRARAAERSRDAVTPPPPSSSLPSRRQISLQVAESVKETLHIGSFQPTSLEVHSLRCPALCC